MEYIQRNFFNAEGRLNRLNFLKLLVILIVTSFILIALTFRIFPDEEYPNLNIFLVYSILITIAVMLYFLEVRRLHDLGYGEDLAKGSVMIFLHQLFILNYNKFAETVFSDIIYIIFFGTLLFLLFKPGIQGENQYGADPLQ